MSDKKDQKETAVLEAKIGELAMWAILGFIIMMFVTSMFGCATWRLPDRTKCVTPWEERKDCISNKECGYDQLCAKRGFAIGKCTLIDCCDPWRGQPGIKSGYDWCTQVELDNDTETRYTY